MFGYCIVGNCQANALASTLQICAEFRERYVFHRVLPIHRIDAQARQDFIKDVVAKAGLIIYQPVSEHYRGGGFSSKDCIRFSRTDAIKISFPSIQFYGYHSFTRVLKTMTREHRQYSNELFGIPGSDLFHYSQVVCAFLFGLSPKSAISVFHEGLRGDVIAAKLGYEESIGILRSSEETNKLDISLLEVIERLYHECNLFWTPRHPTGELLSIVATKVLAQVGIVASRDEQRRFRSKDPLQFPQYPMQNFVVREMGLKFPPVDRFKSTAVDLDVSEMIDRYYEYYNRIGRDRLIKYLADAFPRISAERISFGVHDPSRVTL